MNARSLKVTHYIFILVAIIVMVVLFMWFFSKKNMASNLKGDWIAFSCGSAGNYSSVSSIFLIRPDGSELQQITPNRVSMSMPTWSPDGNWLAFVNNDGLFKIHPDGGDSQPILSDYYTSPNDTLPDWSPDGKYIAFISHRTPSFSWDMYRVNVNGNDLKQLSFDMNAQRSVDWSPDGNWITFAGSTGSDNIGIYKMGIDGEDLERLTNPDQSADEHAWSPDGQQIVFSTQMANNINLALINVNDRHVEQITNINGAATYPEWSPDGKWIIFSMATPTNGIYQLYKVLLDGTNLTQITDGTCNAVSPSWFSFSQ